MAGSLVVVLDSMALIHLAKVSILEEIASKLEVVVPQAVFREAVLDGIGKHADAAVSNGLVKAGRVSVRKVRGAEKLEDFGLAGGEAECVALCLGLRRANRSCLLVSNDLTVEETAKVLGVNWSFVPLFLAVLGKKKKISREKARKAIISLEEIGWYSHRVIETALEALENV